MKIIGYILLAPFILSVGVLVWSWLVALVTRPVEFLIAVVVAIFFIAVTTAGFALTQVKVENV